MIATDQELLEMRKRIHRLYLEADAARAKACEEEEKLKAAMLERAERDFAPPPDDDEVVVGYFTED